MKKVIGLAGVLSWFNMIIGGLITVIMLFGLLMAGANLGLLAVTLLMGSIVLHSYAALQLRKSIVNPALPLDGKTPTGIRFIGFLALFISILNMANAWMVIRNAPELLADMEFPIEPPPGTNLEGMLRGVGYFLLLFSITVSLNVVMNFTLLKLYQQGKTGGNGNSGNA